MPVAGSMPASRPIFAICRLGWRDGCNFQPSLSKITAAIDDDIAGKRIFQLDKNKYYQFRYKGQRRSKFPKTKLHPILIGTVV